MGTKCVIVSKYCHFTYNFLTDFFICKIVVDNKKSRGTESFGLAFRF